MKGDFSRSSFDPQKHYQSVRMQQGRVQLDADWNEQADILLHLVRTPLGDLLGPGATVVTEPGFAITLVESVAEPANQAKAGQPDESPAPARTLPDFHIGPGRYYVEGMLCENEVPVLFSKQPDYPAAASMLQQYKDHDQFLAYLDVWQRHITAVEDPTIREIALGGPDTATRVKTVWQVKLLPLSGDPADDQGWRDRDDLRSLADWKAFVNRTADKGQLRAQCKQGAFLENRLYRVEIHSVAGDQVTFKSSRENGSVVFPIIEQRIEAFTWEDVPESVNEDLRRFLSKDLGLDWAKEAQISNSADGKIIHVEKDGAWAKILLEEGEQTATLTTSDGKRRLLRVAEENGKRKLYVIAHLSVDDQQSIVLNVEGLDRDPYQLQEGSWVELVDDVTALSSRSLPLCQVKELDRPNARVILRAEQEIGQIVAEIGIRELHEPLLRRWEAQAKPIVRPENTAGDQGGGWLELENGIQVAFRDTGTYQVGDYWLIPARTRSTDGIEWPRKDGQPLAQAPHGIAHHYAPLGLLQFKEGYWSVLTEESSAFRSLPRITANLSETEGQLRNVQETTDKRFEAAFSRLREVQQMMATLVGQTHVFAIVKSEESLEKGGVVSLDRAAVERMSADDPRAELPVKLACSKEQDGHLVLGVVTEVMDDHRYRVALYGRVNCKVIGPVKPGDLLVPSPEPGYAERYTWLRWRRPVIGKALSSTVFDEGRQTGTLDMLVTPNYRITGPKAPCKKWVAVGIGAVALILVLSVMGLLLRYFKTFRLDIHAVGGSVKKSPDKDRYSRGEVVSLMAVPDPNCTFDRWSEALSGSANPAVLVMDEDKSVSFVITNSIGMKLVSIPAGSFMMGSRDSAEKLARDYDISDEAGKEEAFANQFPQHRVRISKGFWMGQTEVTQGQYRAVMKAAPWSGKQDVQENANNPAVYVSWDDAVEFCRKLNQQAGKTYRLPTEAEWEYACRAGTTTRFYTGDKEKDLGRAGWYAANAGGQPHAVGGKEPNKFGLYDMHGNVWEWVEDHWHRSYDGAPNDGRAWVDSPGPGRVLRGGAWYNNARSCRSSYRNWLVPSERGGDIGFRVVWSGLGSSE